MSIVMRADRALADWFEPLRSLHGWRWKKAGVKRCTTTKFLASKRNTGEECRMNLRGDRLLRACIKIVRHRFRPTKRLTGFRRPTRGTRGQDFREVLFTERRNALDQQFEVSHFAFFGYELFDLFTDVDGASMLLDNVATASVWTPPVNETQAAGCSASVGAGDRAAAAHPKEWSSFRRPGRQLAE